MLHSDCQIDLLFNRSDDVINICEIKTSPKISNKIINEVQEKIERFDNPKGLTIISILISLYSPPKAIVDSGYFSCDLT